MKVWILTNVQNQTSIVDVYENFEDAVKYIDGRYSPELLPNQASFERKLTKVTDDFFRIMYTSSDFLTPAVYDLKRYGVK